ncbi:unnamed protein product [Calypogeia fissa]
MGHNQQGRVYTKPESQGSRRSLIKDDHKTPIQPRLLSNKVSRMNSVLFQNTEVILLIIILELSSQTIPGPREGSTRIEAQGQPSNQTQGGPELQVQKPSHLGGSEPSSEGGGVSGSRFRRQSSPKIEGVQHELRITLWVPSCTNSQLSRNGPSHNFLPLTEQQPYSHPTPPTDPPVANHTVISSEWLHSSNQVAASRNGILNYFTFLFFSLFLFFLLLSVPAFVLGGSSYWGFVLGGMSNSGNAPADPSRPTQSKLTKHQSFSARNMENQKHPALPEFTVARSPKLAVTKRVHSGPAFQSPSTFPANQHLALWVHLSAHRARTLERPKFSHLSPTEHANPTVQGTIKRTSPPVQLESKSSSSPKHTLILTPSQASHADGPHQKFVVFRGPRNYQTPKSPITSRVPLASIPSKLLSIAEPYFSVPSPLPSECTFESITSTAGPTPNLNTQEINLILTFRH